MPRDFSLGIVISKTIGKPDSVIHMYVAIIYLDRSLLSGSSGFLAYFQRITVWDEVCSLQRTGFTTARSHLRRKLFYSYFSP